MAIARRQSGSGVIYHSDQGVQYASGDYVAELKSHGFEISMAPAGNPYENAMMESFFKTLKYEEVYLCEYETFEDVVKRLHSALDYRPPNEFCIGSIVFGQMDPAKMRHLPLWFPLNRPACSSLFAW